MQARVHKDWHITPLVADVISPSLHAKVGDAARPLPCLPPPDA